MRRLRLAAVAGLVVVAAAATGGTLDRPAPPGPLAIVGVTVLPMDGRGLLTRQTVLVRDGVIAAMGPAGDVAIPADARRIVAPAGSVLMPGLTDTHVHLELLPEGWMPLFVASGVTSVFNLRGTADHLTLRARVDSGAVVGPRIYTSGAYTNQPIIETPAQADSAVRAQRAAGFDFVKVHGRLTEPAYATLDTASAREQIALIGHLPRNLPFDTILAHRMTMVVHAEEYLYTAFARERDSATVARTARQVAAWGNWLTPTLVIFKAIGDQVGRLAVVDSALADPGLALSDTLRRFWRVGPYTGRPADQQARFRAQYDLLVDFTGAVHRAGVPLLAGTDTPLPLVAPGPSLIDELELLVRAGLSTEEALATATRNPGRFVAEHVRPGHRFGTVTVGSTADLLLVPADPRGDLAALRRPLGVAVAGRWFDRTQLDSIRTAVNRR